MQAPSSAGRIKANILKFLGYLVTEKGWHVSQLTLLAYSNVEVVHGYIGFLLARGITPIEVKKHISTGSAVNRYISNTMINSNLGGNGRAVRWVEDESDQAMALRLLETMKAEVSGRRKRELGSIMRWVRAGLLMA